MLSQEFKVWIEHAIRDAKRQGLSEADIYLELLEQVRIYTTRLMYTAVEQQKEVSK